MLEVFDQLKCCPADWSSKSEETGITYAENCRPEGRNRGQDSLAGGHSPMTPASRWMPSARPGVYSARLRGVDPERISRLLAELEGNTLPSAAFHFALALGQTRPEKIVLKAREVCRGRGFLVEPVRGRTQLWLQLRCFYVREAGVQPMPR